MNLELYVPSENDDDMSVEVLNEDDMSGEVLYDDDMSVEIPNDDDMSVENLRRTGTVGGSGVNLRGCSWYMEKLPRKLLPPEISKLAMMKMYTAQFFMYEHKTKTLLM